MTQTQMQDIQNPATGLLVFQTDHISGFYYNAGAPLAPSWQLLSPPSDQTVWKLTGNSGTNPTNDFVGTADNKPLSFRINNITSGFIDSIKARTFLGYGAGNTASTGHGNVALGKSSLSSASTGNANVALGDSALNSCTEGDGSVAVGFYSLAQNAYGVNTAIGYYSLYATPASGNTATGAMTLHANTQGGNTAKGYGAIEANIAGSNNTALGTSALGANASTDNQGYQNTAAGGGALASNFSGRSNTAIGYNTLVTNSSGAANTATGYEALGANLTGTGNTSLGASTIGVTRDGTFLTAIGAHSQGTASTGTEGENTTDGAYALYNNASGVFCTAIGGYALYNNSGKSNTATGYGAMHGTGNNGSDNTAFGANTLTLMVANSDGNTAVGTNALLHSNAGAYNTAAGYAALYLLADSKYNTAIGYGAGVGYALTYTLSHSNTILGANCDVGSDNLNNCIAIGQQVTCTASNQVRIGNLATNSIGGQVGWTTFSDGRFKKNIRENVKGLDFILRLKPVTYQLDIDLLDTKLRPKVSAASNSVIKSSATPDPRMQTAMTVSRQMIHSGFVAQDVEKAALEAGFNFSGIDKPTTADGLYGLRYEDFVVPLVKAVQEQQRQIEALQKGNVDMNKRIQHIQEKIK